MGKYTSLARKIEETNTQKKGVDTGLDNAYKHSMPLDTNGNSVPLYAESPTNLRTTNLTNLTGPEPLYLHTGDATVTCIHRTAEDRCAVCSGYVRWLIADEDRLQAARANPEATRRRYWQTVGEEA